MSTVNMTTMVIQRVKMTTMVIQMSKMTTIVSGNKKLEQGWQHCDTDVITKDCKPETEIQM